MVNKLIALALVITCALACQKHDIIKVKQDHYVIPGDTFFPEGIAYNEKTGIFYTGSTFTGDIVKVNVKTGDAALLSSGEGSGRTFCTGMKLDAKKRLWVCGGSQGRVHLINTNDGSVIKSWDLRALYNAGFVNDCIIADNTYVYFTDSQMQKIYRADVRPDQPGNIEEWLTFTNQQIPYAGGTNANGIEVTPDGKYLLVVISNSGTLYRINTSTKEISQVPLNMPINSGDGLWLEKNKLYVSRNAIGKIFPIVLNADYTAGTVGDGFGENLLFNTTMAKADKYFLVVNGQLNRRPSPTQTIPPVLPFKVSRVLIP
jgi:Cu-Zn family superoxide dismutase